MADDHANQHNSQVGRGRLTMRFDYGHRRQSNPFSNLVALLLVPCLLADPAIAVARSVQCVPHAALRVTRYDPLIFASQALAPVPAEIRPGEPSSNFPVDLAGETSRVAGHVIPPADPLIETHATKSGLITPQALYADYIVNLFSEKPPETTKMGRIIREVRLFEGISQDTLGRQIGLSQERIHEIECGQKILTLQESLAIGVYLNINGGELFRRYVVPSSRAAFTSQDLRSARVWERRSPRRTLMAIQELLAKPRLLGVYFRVARERKGLTIRALAARLGPRWSDARIVHLENWQKAFGPEDVVPLGEALDLDTSGFLSESSKDALHFKAPDLTILSPREREILNLYALGWSYKEIAAGLTNKIKKSAGRMRISVSDVNGHMVSLRKKLQLQHTAPIEFLIEVYRRGWVTIPLEIVKALHEFEKTLQQESIQEFQVLGAVGRGCYIRLAIAKTLGMTRDAVKRRIAVINRKLPKWLPEAFDWVHIDFWVAAAILAAYPASSAVPDSAIVEEIRTYVHAINPLLQTIMAKEGRKEYPAVCALAALVGQGMLQRRFGRAIRVLYKDAIVNDVTQAFLEIEVADRFFYLSFAEGVLKMDDDLKRLRSTEDYNHFLQEYQERGLDQVEFVEMQGDREAFYKARGMVDVYHHKPSYVQENARLYASVRVCVDELRSQLAARAVDDPGTRRLRKSP